VIFSINVYKFKCHLVIIIIVTYAIIFLRTGAGSKCKRKVADSRWYFAFGLLTISQRRKSPACNFSFILHPYIRKLQTGSRRWKSIIILARANTAVFLICISKPLFCRCYQMLLNFIFDDLRQSIAILDNRIFPFAFCCSIVECDYLIILQNKKITFFMKVF